MNQIGKKLKFKKYKILWKILLDTVKDIFEKNK